MKASAGSSRAITSAPSGDVPASSTADRFRTERFRLAGPTQLLDPRVHAIRGDLADRALAGRLFAPYYADPIERACAADFAMMRVAPADDATAVSQLLHGEPFAVFDMAGGWAWGYSLHDHYVGYVRIDALGEVPAASHRVIAATAPIFATASIKSAALGGLPIGSRIAGEADGEFVRSQRGFVHRRHLAPVGDAEPDPVAVAQRLLGQPYLWGGRGAGGVDCSGLIQLAYGLSGIALPRDSDQQRSAGQDVPASRRLRRGDLVFFPGHVGIMVDPETMLHANAYWMAVTCEPLAAVVARLTPHHSQPVIARRRLLP